MPKFVKLSNNNVEYTSDVPAANPIVLLPTCSVYIQNDSVYIQRPTGSQDILSVLVIPGKVFEFQAGTTTFLSNTTPEAVRDKLTSEFFFVPSNPLFFLGNLLDAPGAPVSGSAMFYNTTDQLLYYWDPIFSAWLSVDTYNAQLGTNGNLLPGARFSFDGILMQPPDRGISPKQQAKIISITGSRSTTPNTATVLEVLVGATVLGQILWPAAYYLSANVNINFNAIINIRNAAILDGGTTIDRPNLTINFKYIST